MKKRYLFLVVSSFFVVQNLHGQTKIERTKISSRYDKSKLSALKNQFFEKAKLEKKQAVQFAQAKGIPLVAKTDTSYAELQRILPNGTPLYYTTFNLSAAKSTRTNHLQSGGSLGLDLMGQNMTAHVWDGGLARSSHQEYDGAGGNNRFSIGDGTTALNYHSAHVTGTIIASGINASAKGMAPYAKAIGYDWNNDLSEATEAAAAGMLVSNHSYGYQSNGLPDQYFGAYIQESKDWDELSFNSPNYLMVVAAGNDGSANFNGNPLGGLSNYDKLTGHATSKNNLVVANAQDANVDANGNLISVAINSSSSQGPTDDYRIKPDITGNGTSVYSTLETSNTAYGSLTGTSMASPNVAGSLLLLQQHANNLTGNYMTAATLKGLVLHTADDAGLVGPDAVFGWGLLNAKRAAETLTQKGTKSIIDELTLTSGQTYQITVNSDGLNNLISSISWTDRPGNTVSATNSNSAVLVNDLDVRVSKDGNTFTPWRLTGVTTNGKGDNVKDPYERVDVTGASGTYTISVTNKGNLVGGSQKFTLIVTGIVATPVVCQTAVPTNLKTNTIGANTASLGWDAVAGANYDFRYRTVGATDWTEQSSATNTISLTGLNASTNYEAQVRSKCTDGNTSAYSASLNFTTTQVQLNYCASTGQNVNDEFIENVQLGTINNTSGANGYSDFTTISANLSQNENYTLTVTPKWTGSVYNEGYAAWIDYNKDGDFDDAGEQIWTKTPSSTKPVTGSFTIPASATVGATRLRVAMRYNAVPSNCGSFDYGEVEDYTVNIQAATADVVAPTVPTNLVATGTAQTTTNLSWSASSDNVGVVGYDIYQGTNIIASTQETSYAVTGLTPATSYSFQIVAKDLAGNVSAKSMAVSVTTTSSNISYCASKGSNSSYEWIDLVRLNNLNNVTANDGGYKDYTNLPVANLPYGANTIYFSAGFSSGSYAESWKVWIDFDKDGVFSASEQVVGGSSSSSGTLSSNFTVPATALAGNTRMRVSMKWNAVQTACETFSHGEVEDYTVNIGQASNNYTTFATQDNEPLGSALVSDVTIYPNPVKDVLHINFKQSKDVSYKVFDALGKMLLKGKLGANESLNVAHLSTGVYLIKINDGQKEIVEKFMKQ